MRLQKCLSIVKPDKGNGIVILKRTNYVNFISSLFTNSSRLKQQTTDPTFSWLPSLQQYLHSLSECGEISEADYHRLSPKAATFSQAYGLPKPQNSQLIQFNSFF